MYNEKMKIGKYLRTFGEIGIVKTSYDGIQSKLKNKGKSMIFTRYSLKHVAEVYLILDVTTKHVVITRDITWLHVMYGEYTNIPEVERTYVPIIIATEYEPVIKHHESEDDSKTCEKRYMKLEI